MSSPSSQPLKQFVRAGAGTGKTWSLIRQVIKQALDFKQSKGRWPRVILTTFTRKATEELKERLLLYCLEEKEEATEFIHSTKFLTITTIHGLFNIFLSRYGRVIGLPGGFQIVNPSQSDFLRRQILRDLLIQEKIPDFLNAFGIARLLECLKEFEPVYWMKSSRPLSSSEDFESLYRDRCRIFAQELEELTKEVSSFTDEKWEAYLQTCKSFKILLLSEKKWEDQSKHLLENLKEVSRPRRSKNNPYPSKDWVERSKKIFDKINKLVEKEEFSHKHWPAIVDQLKSFEKLAHLFMEKLVACKKKEAILESNDLEFFSLCMIQEHPQVVQSFSEDFDAWFIDEFQDTNPMQLKILETLIADKFCYYVGDPQQSIYLFRGARSEVFFNKQKQIKKEGYDIQNLTKNYRSQPHLLDFFNGFFTYLDPSSFTTMESSEQTKRSVVESSVNHPEDSRAVVKISVIQSEAQFYEASKGSSSEDCFHKNSTDRDPEPKDLDMVEIYHISEQIRQLLDNGVSPKDICILGRTHSGLDKIQRELMALGFPLISHSSGQFFKRREVLDAMGLLKFLLNPWDDHNLILLLRSPWIGLSDQNLVEVIGDRKYSFWPLFKQFFEEQQKGLRSGQILCQALKEKKHFGVAWCFRKALIELGILDFSLKVDSTGRREANLWKWINFIEKKSRKPGESLLKWVNEGFSQESAKKDYDEQENFDASSSTQPDKIHLMTIHASKGLEFEYVFMPFLHKPPRESSFQDFSLDEKRGLWSLRLPLRAHGQLGAGILEDFVIHEMRQRERKESFRLLYVSMTRCKNRLFLSWQEPKKELNEKSWAFKIKDFFEKNSLSKGIHWLGVDQAEAIAYHRDQVFGKPRLPYQVLTEKTQQVRVDEKSLFWKQVEGNERNRFQGVTFHRLFESLKNHSPQVTVEQAKRDLPDQEGKIQKAVEFLMENKQVPFDEIIKKGFVEWSYRKKQPEGDPQEGRIDLWGVAGDKLWIVDYKTGSSRFKEKAFEQLARYKEVLCEYLQWKGSAHMVAVYPLSQEIFIKT